MYGTEAMGGVINIISKRATAKYSGEIRFKNENFDGISSKLLENPYAHNLSYNISVPILFFRLDLSGISNAPPRKNLQLLEKTR